jgi:ATP-binding cassette subfamily B (MDR/TAP) protein 1
VRGSSGTPIAYLEGANCVFVGQLTAIVGLSGSGKSTVASLISRFYDPQSGEVLLDGRNIKDINVKSLRGFISLVQQEPSLLDRSILENIALGLVNSPPHAYLEKTLLSGTLAKMAEDIRGGQELATAAETAGSEVRRYYHILQLWSTSVYYWTSPKLCSGRGGLQAYVWLVVTC